MNVRKGAEDALIEVQFRISYKDELKETILVISQLNARVAGVPIVVLPVFSSRS